MKKIIGIVMVLLMLISVTVVLAGNAKNTGTGGEKVKVIIGYVDKPNQADEDVIRGHGGKTKYTYHIINAKAVEIPEQAIDRIKRNPRVAYVEEDAKVYALDAELDDSWGVKHICAGVVHGGGNTGAGVNVSIIDTGIDYTHPDLDGNCKGGYDFVNNDNDSMDDAGHGTHCAGIVAAEDDGSGVVGVAPEAHLYGVKVLNSSGIGYVTDVIAGINWSVQNDMQIISMSLGGGNSVSKEAACDAAYNAGIVVVASAGNSGNPPGMGDNVGYPAAYSSVIAVAATASNDKRARWSSTGPDVELAAPGVSIYSTVPGGYGTKSGTSMACPHVAGTAALVMAAYPGWNSSQVRQQLRDTADDLGAAGRDNLYGYGLVDADEAAYQPIDVHDIAVTSIVAPSYVVKGDLVSVNVSVTNEGTYEESFDVTLTDTTDEIGIGSVTLSAEASTTITFIWNTTGATPGAHVLNATADVVTNETDAADNSMTRTVIVVASANRIHVASINMSFKTAGPNRNAIARIKIVDADGAPIGGATVEGHWSNATSDTDSGLTDANGEVALNSAKVRNALSGTNFTFTVDDVLLAGGTYDPAANVETSDSIPTPQGGDLSSPLLSGFRHPADISLQSPSRALFIHILYLARPD